MANQALIAILQASLTPIVMISGVGLLLLSMVNRFARPMDRIRELGKELKNTPKEDKNFYLKQIQILYKRSLILKKAITLAVISIICASCIILLLFLIAIFPIDITFLIQIIFITGMLALVASLIYFLFDIHASLNSIHIELTRLKIQANDATGSA